ncbi:MAG: radical SAM protein, partial [Pseudomonadota bacterium]
MKTLPPHILCVNPWIHDFAAYDFWAKPLGLLGLAAILRKMGLRVTFKDCLDRFHPGAGPRVKVLEDGRGPYRKTPIALPPGLENEPRRYFRYGIDPEWFVGDLKQVEPPDLILVTSLMTYWAPGVRETIRVLKEVFPRTPVILGGIYATLWPDHARETSMADHVITGPGEAGLPELIRTHTGYTFYPGYDADDLDSLPWPAFDLVSKLTYVPILTSRGCPFACRYCASSFLEKRLRQRSPGSVLEEIRHWYHGYGVRNMAFYDDALLIHGESHALPLLEAIARSGIDIRFHTPNALHIREITAETADLMFRAGFRTIRLGLETMDFSESRSLDHKVRYPEVVEALAHLKRAGFTPDSIGAYLLCALPGQDPGDVEASILAVKAMGITPVLA